MKESWKIVSGEHYINQWEAYPEEEKLKRFLLNGDALPSTQWLRLETTKNGHFKITQMTKYVRFSYNKRKFYTICSFKSVVITPHTIRGNKEVLNMYLHSENLYSKFRRRISAEVVYHFFKTGEVIEILKPSSLLERYYNVSFQKWEEYAKDAYKVAQRCYYAGKTFNPEWSKTRIKDEYTKLRMEQAKEESLICPDIRINFTMPLRPVIGPFTIINSERDLKYWSLVFSNCSYSYKSYIRHNECLLFIYHDERSSEWAMGEVRLLDDEVTLCQYMGKHNRYIEQSPEFKEEFKQYTPWFEGYLIPRK